MPPSAFDMDQRSFAPSGMTLRQLELLCAVADYGSFTSAAQAMYLTPNAVALAVTELETHLGATLCIRQRARGVSLTPAGVKVVERARRLLRDAGDLHRAVASTGDELRGPVAVGCYSTLAPTVVPSLLETFSAQHPDVELSCMDGRTLDLVLRLRAGELDLLISYEASLPTDLQQEVLFTSYPVVLLPAGHALAGRSRIELKELAGEPLILMDLPPSGENTLSLLRDAGVRPQVAHRTGSFELVRSLVGRGLGFSIAYQQPASTESYEGRGVVGIPVYPNVGAAQVVVCWSPAMPLTDRSKAVMEFLRGAVPAPPTL